MAFQLELPDIGEGVVEAEVQKWFVAVGDRVVEDQPLLEVMTDKATVVIPSPRRGTVVRRFFEEGQVAKVHAPLVEIEVEEGVAAAPAAPAAPAALAAAKAVAAPSLAAAPPRVQGAAGGKALAAPAVRALARELGVDLAAVAGSGPGGRVMKEDLTVPAVKRNGHGAPGLAPTNGSRSSGEAQVRPPSPAAPAGAAEERLPLRGVRKRIAEKMAHSKRTAAHFTFVEACDATELIRLRDALAEPARAEGVKLTYLAFVVKAVVAALRKFEKLNASLDDAAGEIVLKRHYDIGIATATEGGLLVPVVRGADRRSLLEVAREIERLAADARAGHARPEDQGHSTFTITSLGALGGLFATPVINHPEVAILGLHRMAPTPVVRDGQVVVRQVMNVSVTSDHRVVDGHEAAAFCYEVIRTLEDPARLLLHLT